MASPRRPQANISNPPDPATCPSANESITTAGVFSSTPEDFQMSPEPSQPGSPDGIPDNIPPAVTPPLPPPRHLLDSHSADGASSSVVKADTNTVAVAVASSTKKESAIGEVASSSIVKADTVASSSNKESAIGAVASSSAPMSPGPSTRIVARASGGKATSSFSQGEPQLTTGIRPFAFRDILQDSRSCLLQSTPNRGKAPATATASASGSGSRPRPKKYRLCPIYKVCIFGDRCLCKWHQRCPYGDECQLAHGLHELSQKQCKYYRAGVQCPYGQKCKFIHDS